jgi:hypothetical protein
VIRPLATAVAPGFLPRRGGNFGRMLFSPFKLAGCLFSARRFICISRKIIGAQVIFLSLQRHCFMVIRKRSFLHCIEKNDYTRRQVHERGSPSFAGAIGELGPDNCFDVAGMDLRDIQSRKVA